MVHFHEDGPDPQDPLPRLVTYEEPNGNRVNWDIQDLQTNVNPPITRAIILKNLHLDSKEKE